MAIPSLVGKFDMLPIGTALNSSKKLCSIGNIKVLAIGPNNAYQVNTSFVCNTIHSQINQSEAGNERPTNSPDTMLD